jgi:hypothetical protein
LHDESLFLQGGKLNTHNASAKVKIRSHYFGHSLLGLIGLFMLSVATPAISANPILGQTGRPFSSDLSAGWHFVRTPNPNGGADAISVMHTADTSKSDLDFVGLMIRCHEGGTEAVVVLLRAFPIRAKPHVILETAGKETQFEATITAPGTAVLLPGDAQVLVDGPWRTQDSLSVQINDGQTKIRGVVPLTGLQTAFKVLLAGCRGP